MRIAAVFLALAGAAGCAGSSGQAAAGPVPEARAANADSIAELEAIFYARIDSAQARYTDADVRFMTRMIHHHAQALEMAALAEARTGNSQLRTLAARIINAQNDEIATMQRWLRDRGQPVPSIAADAHAGHDMSMPGMVSPEQMARLEASRDATFDRLFLELMIQHHRGAVEMVAELFATDGAANDEEAFKFASDAQVDQATEVERMELMLRALER